MSATEFEQLQSELANGGAEAVLERLAAHLRQEKKYHELFEALKMRVRQRLGLPLLYNDLGDELAPDQRDALEEGLLAACREVGLALLGQGSIREGWMYMRPVGDQAAVIEALSRIEVNEGNLEELLEVTLQEGVDPVRGFGLVLEHYGTCNAITTFESALARHPKSVQQSAAGLLLENVHRELLENVKADVARQQGAEPQETTLGELVADRQWLFTEHTYHLDTTHLASTVRFARTLEEPRRLRLALDLTDYGRRLSGQFQYPGEEPFVDLYRSHALYFQALLGENLDEAVGYFRERADAVDVHQQGPAAVEVYVDLLARLGRYQQAIDAALTKMPEGVSSLGYAPSLLQLSTLAGDYDRLMDYCRQRNDVLGFSITLLQAAQA